MTRRPAVDLRDVRKAYGATTAVDGVTLTVEEGEVVGVLGPNGAGKTTTVEMVAGLRRPDAGTVRVLGRDPASDRATTTREVGVQLQEAQLPDRITVGEALRLWTSFYAGAPTGTRSTDELAERLGLAEALRTRFADLSGGQRQRLSLALALVGRPRLAVLDELTTGLDPRGRRDVWALVEDLRREGTTVLLVTHGMDEAARLADRVAVLDRGRVVALGTPGELVAGAAAGQTIRVVPSGPVDLDRIRRLAPVRDVVVDGDEVVVTGTEDALAVVVTALSADRIVARRLRVDTATLEDAVLELTGGGPAAAGRPSRPDLVEEPA